jgi:hypothetical protein
VEFTVNDGDLDSGPATRDVHLNDAPVLDSTDAALAYTENDGPVAVDAGITASDADSADLVSATVEVSANFASAEDELAFSDQNGITGSYDDTLGVLTLSGTASVADYEAALRSVTYSNSSEDPSEATRTVTFRVDDGNIENHASDPVTRDIEVTSVNDPPVVTTSAGSVAYTEGDPGTVVDDAVTVSDVDDANLESAQVQIASGFVAGDDLTYVDQLGIAGVYNTGTGVLTLTGSASVADYETALRSIEFSHAGDDPTSATRSIEFVVNDGDADSAAATRAVDVTPVNDAPSVTTSEGSTAYTSGDAAAAVDSALTVADVDDASLEGATVQLASGFEAGDALTFAGQGGIAGIYDSENGVLTLTGTASVADYETALRSVGYSNGGSSGSASRTVEFKVNDGDADSNVASKTIDVTNPNAAPVVTTSEGTTEFAPGGSAVDIDAALTVSDADDADLEGAVVTIASGFELGDDLAFANQAGIAGLYNSVTGVLTLTGTASASDYQTALASIKFDSTVATAPSSRTIEYKVSDGEDESAVASKTIDVADPNTAPVVTTSSGSTSYGSGDPAVDVDAAVTVSDANDANLESATVRISSGAEGSDVLLFEEQAGITPSFDPENGILTLSGTATVAEYEAALRSVQFQSSGATVPSSRTVEFKVSDGQDESAAASKTIDVTGPQF